jgi:hypothetical protein
MRETAAVVAYSHDGTDRIYTFDKACNDHLDVNFWNDRTSRLPFGPV